MSSNCSFEQHIIELRKRCTGMCGWILRTFSSRESTVMTLFKSLVLSRLDYGSQIWSPTKIHHIIKIEKIQKAFTKHIKGFSSFSYQERLSNLKIYSLQRRRERYIVIYVWKFCQTSLTLSLALSLIVGEELVLYVILVRVDWAP